MNERIKELRKELGLTQEEFSSKIGVKRNTVAQYEIGRGNPIDSVVFSICREFNVNEEWLRHGIGDMFVFIPSDELEALAQRYELPDMAKRIVKGFVELDAPAMASVLDFITKVVDENDEVIEAFAPLEPKNNRRNEFADELDRAQDILNKQGRIDKLHNANVKKERSSS